MGPTWSPDGTQIAFSSERPEDTGSEIYIMNADGSNQHKLISLPDTEEDDIDWGKLVGGPISSPTFSPTPTNTPLFSPTPSATPEFTPTPSNTPQYSPTPSATPVNTNTPTPTNTSTPIPINTSTPTPTMSLTPTPTLQVSNTVTPTFVQGNICGKADSDNDGVFKLIDFAAYAIIYGSDENSCSDVNVDYGACGGRDVDRDGDLDLTDFGGENIGFAQRYFPKSSCALD